MYVGSFKGAVASLPEGKSCGLCSMLCAAQLPLDQTLALWKKELNHFPV